MPITTVQQEMLFPVVGKICKGEAKRRVKRDGRDIEVVGPDLGQRFRVAFSPGTDDLRDGFIQAYGSLEPEIISAILPFRRSQDCLRAHNEAYMNGRMVAQADGDHYLTLRDPLTGEYLVRNGEPYKPWAPGDTISYERNGKPYVLKFKPHGRLKLVLPYTIRPGSVRLVHFILKTTSFYDCVNWEGNLAAIQAFADVLSGGNCGGIPIMIYRKATDIPWSHDDGTVTMTSKWLVYIEIDPAWVADRMDRLRSGLDSGTTLPALPAAGGSTPVMTPPLGVGAPNPEEDDDDDPEEGDGVIDAPAAAGVSIETPAQVPPPVEGMPDARPYGPGVLRRRLQLAAQRMAGQRATGTQRGGLIGLLNRALWAPSQDAVALDGARYTVLKYLTGHGHMRDVPDEMVLAMLKGWIRPYQDTGGEWHPSEESAIEARAVYRAAQVENGQLELPVEGGAA